MCDKEAEISEIKTHLIYIRKTLDDIKPDIKANTELRSNIKTIIGFAVTISTALGGTIVGLVNYLLKFKN